MPIQPIIKLDFAKRDRVAYKNELEKAQDQVDGITRAQDKQKKDAPPGEKQNGIQSTKKSQQGENYILKRIRNLSDLDNFDIKVIESNGQQK